MENTPPSGKKKTKTKHTTKFAHSFRVKCFFFFLYINFIKWLYLKLMRRWNEGGKEQISDGVMQIIRTLGRNAEEKPSEVCIKTAVSYSCCITRSRKP